ncbi:Fur family transcriptional regulator [Knoellia sinensis KCTC 19936]|uniref:Fur family transcriptional regulator n=1 Tax=Knoellia sinensis KCTC 19936 TaxID=1385520 RepID=A0A0A0JBT0_9MICO|nr:transcriptional repressor [Knoellia sinensis]KGN34618.1 Fur family transcriptional regulator [Knoellia sinensis KCTC 19936]
MSSSTTDSGPTRRPTRQRAALAEVMAATSEFLSAQDLHAKLQSRGDSVGLATVYRNLQAMASDGDVDVLRTDDGEAVYRSCGTAEHHHHLVCRECGRTVEVDGPAVEKWAAEVARANGFTDVTHTIEIFGTCTSH